MIVSTLLAMQNSQGLLIDSLIVSGVQAIDSEVSNCSVILDVIYKLAMIAIALFNVFYVCKLNKSKDKKESAKEENEKQRNEEERKIALLKSLVFDYNLENLYDFFAKANDELLKLKEQNADKVAIEAELQSIFKDLGDNFIIFLLATTSQLGKKFQDVSDSMRDELVNNISDDGINLYVDRYYNDKIKMVFDNGRNKMINLLFQYDGK